MARALKCDRCGVYADAHDNEFGNDLCPACKAEWDAIYARWEMERQAFFANSSRRTDEVETR